MCWPIDPAAIRERTIQVNSVRRHRLILHKMKASLLLPPGPAYLMFQGASCPCAKTLQRSKYSWLLENCDIDSLAALWVTIELEGPSRRRKGGKKEGRKKQWREKFGRRVGRGRGYKPDELAVYFSLQFFSFLGWNWNMFKSSMISLIMKQTFSTNEMPLIFLKSDFVLHWIWKSSWRKKIMQSLPASKYLA